MTQQINLFTPILLTQKRYFSAQAMAQALIVFIFLAGGLCAYWVWSLDDAGEKVRKSLLTQSRELSNLQAILQQGKVSSGSAQLALTQDLQTRRATLLQREKLMDELKRGLFQPGFGHAARLQLVAQSIPARAWVTEIKADDTQFSVSGLTLDPAVLNEWVGKLAASPLLKGQKLETVKVENASASASASAPTSPRPVWTFTLISAIDKSYAAGGSNP